MNEPSAKPVELLTAKERLALAREEKAKREAERVALADARELEILELEAKLEGELGPRGEAFEIVETVEGPIAIKLGEAVLYQRFQASKFTEADTNDFVFSCVVHPSQAKYQEIVGKRPGIAGRCALALGSLFGVRREADAKKF